MDLLIYALLGLVGGGLATWLALRLLSARSPGAPPANPLAQPLSEAQANLRVAHDRLERLADQLQQLQQELATSQQRREALALEHAALRARHEEQNNGYLAQRQELDGLRRQVEQKAGENQQLAKQLAEAGAKLESLSGLLQAQRQEVEAIGSRFTHEFKVLADSILEEKSRRFAEANQINIERLLKPLGENIAQFQRRVDEVYDRESKERFSLGREVERLVALNQQISQEAQNLTNALKGQVKQQGNWGEMILESILDKSGLTKGREYTVQESLRDPEGNRLQPDVIITYPDNRRVVIDSKVSLVAYERYCSAAAPEEQEKALAEHFRSVRSHVDTLRQKDYQALVGSLDFVIMFVPIEPAYILAMQCDQDLWSYAYSRGVLLISPTNLIAALRLIYGLWQREYQNRNALEIAERGGQLYDKFVSLAESLGAVGDNLQRTQKSFDSAMGHLTEKRGNLLAQAQKLKDLGAKARKSLPGNLGEALDGLPPAPDPT